jgi:hypothetical protein
VTHASRLAGPNAEPDGGAHGITHRCSHKRKRPSRLVMKETFQTQRPGASQEPTASPTEEPTASPTAAPTEAPTAVSFYAKQGQSCRILLLQLMWSYPLRRVRRRPPRQHRLLAPP